MGIPDAAYQMTGEPPVRTGNDGVGSAPSGVFSCSDGEVLLQAGKDPDFVKLCRVLGIEEVTKDPRFAFRPNRVRNFEELRPTLNAAIAKWSRLDLYNAMVEAGIICGPINTIDDAFADPQVITNGVHQPANHPDDPSLKLITSPIRYSNAAPGIRRYPPRMGEHTTEILREVLAMTPDAIAELGKKKVIGFGPEPVGKA
jgi:crotonobetainyl-CoA:carnitine CoA-transferase CaiB-like acyl-CoA transferase